MAFILYFLIYKQKAPVDLLFLEFHTDNDVARIISALSVTGGGTHTNNPTCINGALADFREYITGEPKRRNKDASQQTRGGSTLELSINKIGFCQQMAKKELLIKLNKIRHFFHQRTPKF